MESTESDYNDLSRDELVDLLVQTKKAQSGSDKTVKKQREQIEELEGKLNTFGEDGTQLQNAAEKLKRREQLVKLKEQGIEYALENNIPAKIGTMIAAGAGTAEEVTDNIDFILEQINAASDQKTEATVQERFGDGHVPKTGDGVDMQMPQNYDELLNWDFDAKPVPGSVVNDIVDDATKRENKKKQIGEKLRNTRLGRAFNG